MKHREREPRKGMANKDKVKKKRYTVNIKIPALRNTRLDKRIFKKYIYN